MVFLATATSPARTPSNGTAVSPLEPVATNTLNFQGLNPIGGGGGPTQPADVEVLYRTDAQGKEWVVLINYGSSTAEMAGVGAGGAAVSVPPFGTSVIPAAAESSGAQGLDGSLSHGSEADG